MTKKIDEMRIANAFAQAAIGIGQRLMTVGSCDYYGQRISRDDYGSLFDDLVRYGLAEVNGEGIIHLTPRGIKAVNEISKQTFKALEKA